ncbi:MAG TPA: hypothetical protein PKK11_06245 [Methanothrix sp.]|nr:hypothetical protein [Methanothrix sp.]HPT19490.1 hypothetical protein [Methanothrix sp.]
MAKKEKKTESREGNRDESRPVPASLEKAAEKASRTPQKPAKVKPRSAAEKRKDRMDGIVKTVYSSLLGAIAGFACYYNAEALAPFPWHTVMILVIFVTFLIQKHTYGLLKIDANAFKTKDWLYVEFMVVDLWLVVWTILLN